MNSKILVLSNEENINALVAMKEGLLILQNTHDAVLLIIKKIEDKSSVEDATFIEILIEEALVMDSEIKRMRIMINQKIALTKENSY